MVTVVSQSGACIHVTDKYYETVNNSMVEVENNSKCDGGDDLFSHWHHWMTMMMRLLCLPDLLSTTATDSYRHLPGP